MPPIASGAAVVVKIGSELHGDPGIFTKPVLPLHASANDQRLVAEALSGPSGRAETPVIGQHEGVVEQDMASASISAAPTIEASFLETENWIGAINICRNPRQLGVGAR